MIHTRPLDDEAWWALANYFRGDMTHDEQLGLEDHLEICAVCRAELEELNESLTPLLSVTPDAPLDAEHVLRLVKEKMHASLEKAYGAPSDRSTHQTWKDWSVQPGGLIRAGEGEWEPTGIPGIEVQRLFVEPNREFVTMRVRMAPGTSYPAHRHGGREQCFVLRGDLRAGERVMRDGDFEVVEEGSEHPVQWTQDGCELLIVSSTSDSFL